MASPAKSPKTVAFKLDQHPKENVSSPLATNIQSLPGTNAPPDSTPHAPTATSGKTVSLEGAKTAQERAQDARLKSPSVSSTSIKSDADRPRMTSSEAARIAQQLRNKNSTVAHEHMRSVKYDVAKLREHLLKVEEQVRALSRGKGTLELAVQDVRKDLSTNQQSVDVQQKKSRHSEGNCLRMLEEERLVLSKCKRSIESHLHVVKNQLIALDSVRKSLQAKIALLSKDLTLDAQNFKICHNPKSPGPITQGDYQSLCPVPKSVITDEESATMCTKAVDLITASVAIATEIKSLIVTTQSRRMEAQEKVSSAISEKAVEADQQRGELLLQRGQLRLAQSSNAHQIHTEQLALGTLRGPVSDKHRSVSEKPDRPLNRTRPATVCEERAELQRYTGKLNRHLSAMSTRDLDLSRQDEQLVKKLREEAKEVAMDAETLRIRRVPLQNRWVK